MPAVARYILAPDLRLQRVEAQQWRVMAADKVVASVEIVSGYACRAEARHAPQFGVSLPVDCLAVTLVDGRATTHWRWDGDCRNDSVGA